MKKKKSKRRGKLTKQATKNLKKTMMLEWKWKDEMTAWVMQLTMRLH